MLDSTGEQDAHDAQRHVILLTSDLVSCGYDRLDVTTSEPGPFNPGFKIPQPINGGDIVLNNNYFLSCAGQSSLCYCTLNVTVIIASN